MNGKMYVGITQRTLDERWKSHVFSARNNSSYRFHQAIRKYGIDAFQGVVLEESVPSEMIATEECKWIVLLGTKNYALGYNMTNGGEGATGRVVSNETRERHRNSQLGKKASEETKAKMRESHKRRAKISEQTREKLRLNAQINNPWKNHVGHSHSEETKKKISESQKIRFAKRCMNTVEV